MLTVKRVDMQNGELKPRALPVWGIQTEIIDPLKFSSLAFAFSVVGLIGIWGWFCCGMKYCIKTHLGIELVQCLPVNGRRPTFHFNQKQKLENVTP